MIRINTAEELSLYDLEGKWNDYIGVQKEVLKVLREEKYFDEFNVTNAESNMCIRITAKGIRETLGNGNRFKALPKKFKVLKVATIRSLPKLIETGSLIADNVRNIHEKEGFEFAYIVNELKIDGKLVKIRIAIKKKVTTNYFWIHNIDEY